MRRFGSFSPWVQVIASPELLWSPLRENDETEGEPSCRDTYRGINALRMSGYRETRQRHRWRGGPTRRETRKNAPRLTVGWPAARSVIISFSVIASILHNAQPSTEKRDSDGRRGGIISRRFSPSLSDRRERDISRGRYCEFVGRARKGGRRCGNYCATMYHRIH